MWSRYDLQKILSGNLGSGKNFGEGYYGYERGGLVEEEKRKQKLKFLAFLNSYKEPNPKVGRPKKLESTNKQQPTYVG